MRKKIACAVVAITLFSGLAFAGDSITPGNHMNGAPTLWQKAKVVWCVLFSLAK